MQYRAQWLLSRGDPRIGVSSSVSSALHSREHGFAQRWQTTEPTETHSRELCVAPISIRGVGSIRVGYVIEGVCCTCGHDPYLLPAQHMPPRIKTASGLCPRTSEPR
jgi:hypothetical protein